MATVKHRFGPRDALYPASAYAQYKAVSGTSFPVESLAFDAATEEMIYFQFPAINYGSGNITVRIRWYADTATTAVVVRWAAGIAAISPDIDTQDIETKAFPNTTANDQFFDDTHLTTTGQRLHECTITVTSTDSIAAEDWCVLRLTRVAAHANDSMTGDCLVTEVGVDYSDT